MVQNSIPAASVANFAGSDQKTLAVSVQAPALDKAEFGPLTHDLPKVFAMLSIRHSANLDAVSAGLGLRNFVFTPFEPSVYSTRNCWVLSSQGIKTNSAEEHIEWILAQVSNKVDSLLRLKNAGAKIHLEIRSAQKLDFESLHISVETVLAMEQLGLRLSAA